MPFKRILKMMLLTAGVALLVACNNDKETLDTTEPVVIKPDVTEPIVTEPSITSIAEIQGDGHISPHVGSVVTTQGIVTALAFRSYYIQDPVGDGNEETSEGLFISHKDHGLSIGDEVQLTEHIIEKIPGGERSGNLSITQMNTPSTVVISTGNPLPAPTLIGLNGRIAPSTIIISENEISPPINLQNAVDDAANTFNPAVDGIDFYESLEGMLVTVEDAQAVSATRRFGRFSAEFFVVPNRGHQDIIEPDSAMTQRGGILLQPHLDATGDANPERLQIQLSGSPLYPGNMDLQVKVGDFVGNVTGVMGYSFGNFEINALHEITVVDGATKPETTSLNITANHLLVAAYNILNLSVADPDDAAQVAKLGEQIVNALKSPDVIALQEIQDDSGTDNDGVTTSQATRQMLIDAISNAGGPTYTAFDVAPNNNTQGGVPGGNIRTAFLYNPNRVNLIEFTALTPEILTIAGADHTAFDGTRVPLVGLFEKNGSRFAVINVHNTSRFGSSPRFGGPQPFVQAGEAERESESKALNQYVEFLLQAYADAQIMVVGDFNTFEWTDELLEDVPGSNHILHNLVPYQNNNAVQGDYYSFIFQGNSQMLDHFFVTSPLLASAKFDVVYLNVDFPRTFINTTASDHEPLLATFELDPTKTNFSLSTLHRVE